MTVYCYGRFRIPHSGHGKLFYASDVVLVSKPASIGHLQALEKFSCRRVIGICKGTLLNWLNCPGNVNKDCDVIVLGEDNAQLGTALAKQGYSVQLIDRSAEDVSSTAVRKLFIDCESKDKALAQAVSLGWYNSLEQASIAYELWQEGL